MLKNAKFSQRPLFVSVFVFVDFEIFSHVTILNRVSHTHSLEAPKKLICSPCCSTQQYTFGPMDYESLQKELALKDTMWTKVSPTECNEDSSTTVVYRMENVGEGN